MRTIILLAILGVSGLVGCSNEVPSRQQSRIDGNQLDAGGKTKKKNKKKGSTDDPESTERSPAVKKLTSEDAFKRTVYPIAKERCGGASCHGDAVSPRFGADEADSAHDDLIDSGKINFDNVLQSRLVKRLAEDNHNCWSDCLANGAEMTAAIEAWRNLIEVKNEEPKNRTATLDIWGTDATVNATAGDLVFEAEDGVVAAPMQRIEDPMASGGFVVGSLNGTMPESVESEAAGAGSVLYPFELNEGGTYQIFALINAPSNQDNEIYVAIDEAPPVLWTIGPNAQYDWLGAPGTYELEKGAHTLRVIRREAGVMWDSIAISQAQNFAGDEINQFRKIQTMRFDLEKLTGKKDTWFEIDVNRFDNLSYLISNPTLVSPEDGLNIAKIEIVLNNVQNPQLATYTIVDTQVDAGSTVLSDSTMIVPKGETPQSDKMAIQFEVIGF